MAIEKQEQAAPEEKGGIVTTIRTETTSDLDVLRAIEESKADADEQQEKPPAPDAADEKKPGEKKAPTGESKKTDDDDEDSLDFEKLSPAEKKLVGKAFKQQRQRNRKEARELSDRIATLEAQLSEKKGSTETQPQPKAQELAKPVRPKRSAFEAGDAGETKFDEEMSKYDDRMHAYRKAIETQEETVKKQADEDKATIENFNKLADEFAEEHPDYEEVMDSDVPITAIMFGYMLEEGPALGYYFGKNHEEAEKISKLPPRKQEKAIARIIVKLEDAAEATKKAAKGTTETTTVTKEKKPEPPKPVAARGGTTVGKDPSKMTFKEREKEFARTHPGVLNYEP